MNDQSYPNSLPNIDPLLCDQEAAQVLGTTSASLKQSRYTGQLFGKPAPRFMKMGRSARYRLSVLLRFRDQFPEYQNTSEFPVSEEAE
ncbi:MAG: hypothetical protein O2971_13240 [Proteobacteria bacterium]|nr:hypothetical protein [Pseudomonadota bacterium]